MQLDLICIYRTAHLKTAVYPLFFRGKWKSPGQTIILGHKMGFNIKEWNHAEYIL